MEKIPIHFEHHGQKYTGFLVPVHGGGSAKTWHLMIDNYYCGRLRYTDKWVFDPTPKTESFRELADWFGDYVTLWHG